MPRKNNSKSKSKTNTKSKTKTKSISNTLRNSMSSMPGIPPSMSGSPPGPSELLISRIRTTSTIFSTILNIAVLFINIYAINWIHKLEDIPECKCSNNWMRTYIKYYLYIIIPFSIIMLLVNIYLSFNNLSTISGKVNLYKSMNTSVFFDIYLFFVAIVSIAAFINMIISIIFINKLKEINCECSEDVRREIYYIYNIVLASFICIGILLAFMSIPFSILRLK
jgi:hypothetical protein